MAFCFKPKSQVTQFHTSGMIQMPGGDNALEIPQPMMNISWWINPPALTPWLRKLRCAIHSVLEVHPGMCPNCHSSKLFIITSYIAFLFSLFHFPIPLLMIYLIWWQINYYYFIRCLTSWFWEHAIQDNLLPIETLPDLGVILCYFL